MNERIKELIKQAQVNDLAIDTNGDPYDVKRLDPEKFAELIVRECAQLNRQQSYELKGVLVDTEDGDGFDAVCLTTVQRVHEYLAINTLEKHFGVEE